jgi:hypothetical protein
MQHRRPDPPCLSAAEKWHRAVNFHIKSKRQNCQPRLCAFNSTLTLDSQLQLQRGGRKIGSARNKLRAAELLRVTACNGEGGTLPLRHEMENHGGSLHGGSLHYVMRWIARHAMDHYVM